MNPHVIDPPRSFVPPAASLCSRWSREQVASLFALLFHDLLFRAQQAHREHFDAGKVQLSTLLSVKPAVVQKIAAIAR